MPGYLKNQPFQLNAVWHFLGSIGVQKITSIQIEVKLGIVNRIIFI